MAIHGNKNQNQRTRALEAFKSGKVDTLVATDVAARGIDIPLITHVFNFELPNVPEQYVHRIGRTARAEASGMAISFVATEKDSDEGKYLKDIEKLLKEKIPEAEKPEDLEGDIKALRARKALPKPEKPQPDARRGRGKSRKKKKGRFSKDRAKKDGAKKSDGAKPKGASQPRGRGNPSRAMPGDEPKKSNPSREGRSRKAPSKSQGKKPARMTGEASTDTRSRKPQTGPSKAPSKGRGSGGDSAPKRRRNNRRRKPGRKSGNKPRGGAAP